MAQVLAGRGALQRVRQPIQGRAALVAYPEAMMLHGRARGGGRGEEAVVLVAIAWWWQSTEPPREEVEGGGRGERAHVCAPGRVDVVGIVARRVGLEGGEVFGRRQVNCPRRL